MYDVKMIITMIDDKISYIIHIPNCKRSVKIYHKYRLYRLPEDQFLWILIINQPLSLLFLLTKKKFYKVSHSHLFVVSLFCELSTATRVRMLARIFQYSVCTLYVLGQKCCACKVPEQGHRNNQSNWQCYLYQ